MSENPRSLGSSNSLPDVSQTSDSTVTQSVQHKRFSLGTTPSTPRVTTPPHLSTSQWVHTRTSVSPFDHSLRKRDDWPPPTRNGTPKARTFVVKEANSFQLASSADTTKPQQYPIRSHFGLPHFAEVLVCVAGIYIFFLLQGITQQQMYKLKDEDVQFSFTFTLMASVTLCGFVLAKLVTHIMKVVQGGGADPSLCHGAHPSTVPCDSPQRKGFGPLDHFRVKLKMLWTDPATRDAALCSASFVAAKCTGWHALTMVDFPSQALSKCAKPVAVFLVSFFTKTQKYSTTQIGIVVWIVASLFAFNMAKPYTSDAEVKSTIAGNCLLLLSLVCEGYTADRQDKLAIAHRMTAMQMMEHVNKGALVLIFPVALFELPKFIAFCFRFPSLATMLVVFAVSSAAGQIFLYAAISLIGALHTSLITTSRKLLMVLISVFLFDKGLLPPQWASLASVFSAVITKSFITYRKATDTTHCRGWMDGVFRRLPLALRGTQKYHHTDDETEFATRQELDMGAGGGARPGPDLLPMYLMHADVCRDRNH